MDYKVKWTESQTDLQQQLKTAKKVTLYLLHTYIYIYMYMYMYTKCVLIHCTYMYLYLYSACTLTTCIILLLVGGPLTPELLLPLSLCVCVCVCVCVGST